MNSVRTFSRIAVLASLFIAYGCDANFYSVYRDFRTHDHSVLIDAKQRMIAINEGQSEDSKGAPIPKTFVCAEPSPDALSAMSGAVSTSASYQQVSAQLAASISEVASSIGLRTQTIQLLRDGMYRICEGYMNGALSEEDFLKTQRRYQIMTAGLMAIESLTGVVTPKQVILRGESQASTGKNIMEAEQNLKDSKENLKAAESEEGQATLALAEATKTHNTFEATLDVNPDNRKPEDQAKLADLKKKMDEAQKLADGKTEARKSKKGVVDEMQALLEAAKTLTTRASTSGSFNSTPCAPNCRPPFSEVNNNKLLETVQGIVDGMFKPDVTYECIDIYKNNKGKKDPPKQLEELCGKAFEVTKDRLTTPMSLFNK